MRFTKDQVLEHLDSIIDRQREEIEILVDTKPMPVSTLRRSRAQLNELISVKKACEQDDPSCQEYLNRFEQDMLMFGWDME